QYALAVLRRVQLSTQCLNRKMHAEHPAEYTAPVQRPRNSQLSRPTQFESSESRYTLLTA
ncbi:MAG: hypothetical protein ACPHJ3_07245, partial [Rubripirellula sp.]